MGIIDAHIHIFGPHANDMAKRAGHENSTEHLRQEYARLGIDGAVVMGNFPLDLDAHIYPEFLRYCVGLDTHSRWEDRPNETYDIVEQHLQRSTCVGIKLYPGYGSFYVSDEIYGPVYELAERYGKPVAIHTGETAHPRAHMKYCHPMTLDDAAADFPRVRFVMCHTGNPWFVDAAAVISKNKNVSADLSGMLEGQIDMDEYFREQDGYMRHIRTWIAYMNAYDRLMYATDWPLANMKNTIDFVAALIPEKHHDSVFCGNARWIYGFDI